MPPLLLTAWVVLAPIDVMPGDDLKTVLSGLQAGDVVTIHQGTYGPMGFTDFVWQGTAQDPIVVQGADGEQVTILGDASQNTMNIQGSYFTVRNLTIEGGSHGIRLGSCDHATFEDLVIHGTADVGISCNRPGNVCEALAIRGVEIYDTGQGGGPGECMYLGCNDDGCQMFDSVIEWNYCHDTTAGSQGDGIEVKTGSYNNVVRHNVIHDVKYPALTFYGTVGNKAPNRVEGNVAFRVGDNGIQTVGDVIVENNIVFDVGANGIHAKPSQGEQVENLRIVGNTVYDPNGTCLKGNDWGLGAGNIEVRNNALLCPGGMAANLVGGDGGAAMGGNGVVGSVAGVAGGTFDLGSVDAAVQDAAAWNFYPVAGGPLVDAGDPAAVPAEDFDCMPRDDGAVDVGAYEYRDPGQPAWPIQEGFKQCDAGGGGTGGGGTGGTGGDSGGGTTGSGTTGGGPTTATAGGTGNGGSASGGGASDGTSGPGSGTDAGGETDGSGSQGEGGGCGCVSARSDRAGGALVVTLVLAGLGRRRHGLA